MNDEELDWMVDEIQKAMDEAAAGSFSRIAIREAMAPVNVGELVNPDGHGSLTGPCGDTMDFFIRVDGRRIAEVRFTTDGCGSTIACGSMLTRLVEGRMLDEAGRITEEELIEALEGLPDENRHCAKLAVDALRATLENKCK